MRESIIFYRSFYEAIKELPPDMQAEVYNAIFEYSLNYNYLELSGVSKTVFTLIKPQLDANNRKYENGKKGGRKKQNETKTKPNLNQSKTKTEANVNDNVNDNEDKELIDYEKFIEFFNSFANRNFKINDKLKNTLKTRLKSYTKKQIQDAIENAHKDQYHKENNFKYLTPEFILRTDKLERFLNTPSSLPRIQKIYLDQP